MQLKDFLLSHFLAVLSKSVMTVKSVTSATISHISFATQHRKKMWLTDSASLQNKQVLSSSGLRLAKLSGVSTLPLPSTHRKTYILGGT
jgi:hypothetical protein